MTPTAMSKPKPKPHTSDDGRGTFESPKDLQLFLWFRTKGEYKCMGKALKNEGACGNRLGEEKKHDIGQHITDFVNAGFPSLEARKALSRIVSSSLCYQHGENKTVWTSIRLKGLTQAEHLYSKWLGELWAAFFQLHNPGEVPEKSQNVPPLDSKPDVWRKQATSPVPAPRLKRAFTSTGVAAGRLTEVSKQFFKQLRNEIREKNARKGTRKNGACKNDFDNRDANDDANEPDANAAGAGDPKAKETEANNHEANDYQANEADINDNANESDTNDSEANDPTDNGREANDPETDANLPANSPSSDGSLLKPYPENSAAHPTTPTLRRSRRIEEKSARSRRSITPLSSPDTSPAPSSTFDKDTDGTPNFKTPDTPYSSVSSTGSNNLSRFGRLARVSRDQSPSPAARKPKDDSVDNSKDNRINSSKNDGVSKDNSVGNSKGNNVNNSKERVIINSKNNRINSSKDDSVSNSKDDNVDNSKEITIDNSKQIVINNSKEGVVLYYQTKSEETALMSSREKLKENFPSVEISLQPPNTRRRQSSSVQHQTPKNITPGCFKEYSRRPKVTLRSMIDKLHEPVLDAKKFQEGYIYGFRVAGCDDFIKIGVTNANVESRLKKWKTQCKAEPILLFEAWMPCAPFVMETMIHAHLLGRRHWLNCPNCVRRHREWFKFKLEELHIALDSVLKWQAFSTSKPFTENRCLEEFWHDKTVLAWDAYTKGKKWDPGSWVNEYIWQTLLELQAEGQSSTPRKEKDLERAGKGDANKHGQESGKGEKVSTKQFEVRVKEGKIGEEEKREGVVGKKRGRKRKN